MSLRPQFFEPIPEETQRLARRHSPKGSLVMRVRDRLGTVYLDVHFDDLYPSKGQPALAPWRLTLVTIFQALFHLTDREAAEAVLMRLDWRYALSLPMDGSGFHFSALSAFRNRLVQSDLAEQILGPILLICKREGWLKPSDIQRSDSTIVLSAVRSLNSVEAVGEALRAALNDLAVDAPEWVLSVVPQTWFDRYGERVDVRRIGKSAAERERWRTQIGADALMLLRACRGNDVPKQVREQETVHLLQQVWDQHYEEVMGEAHWRDGPAVNNEERIVSPYDQDARASNKRGTTWLGYKVHLTETCSREPGQLNVIVDVQTTPATTSDALMLEPILAQGRTRGLTPKEMVVDQGYMSAEMVVRQRAQGTEVLGPLPKGTGWQAKVDGGLTQEQFELDVVNKTARCPQGKMAISWKDKKDNRGKTTQEIRFATADCQACVSRSVCCRGERGRFLSLVNEQEYEVVQQSRDPKKQEEFLKRYAIRAGVESCIAQAVKRTGVRQARYLGMKKTHLQEVMAAAALNLVRIDAHLQWQAQGYAGKPPRPDAAFRRLQAKGA